MFTKSAPTRRQKSVRFGLAYLFLVGAPILMLMAVLKYGQRLTASPSIDGAWTLITDSNPTLSPSCAVVASIAQPSTVMISQSGKSVVVHFANDLIPSASGRLDDQTLKVSFSFKRGFSMPGCPNSHAFFWTAFLDHTPSPTSLTGYWSVDGCPLCASRSVKATRQEP
jgi:hypothetical protein